MIRNIQITNKQETGRDEEQGTAMKTLENRTGYYKRISGMADSV